MYRRGFLRQTLGACWVGASLLEQAVLRATQARAQASPGLPALFDFEKVAEGIWAAIARPQALINSNAAIFEQSDGLLIVDTHSKPSAVVALVSQIRRELTQKPVRYIVNSHFHWDHSQGNGGYRRLAPNADIVASEPTRRLIANLGAARLKASLEETRKSMDGYRNGLATAKTAEEKAYFQRMVDESSAYLNEMRDWKPELPNLTFDRDLILHGKSHDLHLVFRGRGHTAGDVVVLCPQKRVVATGDLLHGFAPWLTDSYPLEWPRTLLEVAQLDFNRVIGGHAAVQISKDRLYQKAAFIEELTDVVVRGRKEGRPAGEIKTRTKPGDLKSLARGGYGQFLVESHRRYEFMAPARRNGDVLSELVAQSIEQIAAALDQNT